MKLLAIVGSPKLKGNTNYLVDQALEEASKLGAEIEKLILGQYKLNPCLGHDDYASFDLCLRQDDAAWILDRFCEADGVILATPVYYYNVSAQMKAFIDRNYFLLYAHDRKAQVKEGGQLIVEFDDSGQLEMGSLLTPLGKESLQPMMLYLGNFGAWIQKESPNC